MHWMWFAVVAALCVHCCRGLVPSMSGQWAVGIRGEGSSQELEQRAQNVAKEHGLLFKGQVAGVPGVFELALPRSAVDNSSELTRSLQLNEEVVLAEQQPLLLRELKTVPLEKKPIQVETSDVGVLQEQGKRGKGSRSSNVAYFKYPTDPLWSKQWSLYNTGQSGGRSGIDLNVLPAWIQGYTGLGVVVSVVDDGVERTHPDLNTNFDWTASLNTVDGSSDPSPATSYDNHGTSCAGIIAMEKSNDHCGVGVAHRANLGGITFDLNEVTDIVESSMLSHQPDYISIYSNSWGPLDSGFVVGGPGKYTEAVLKLGATEGRGGLGNIYTFAGGNGGSNGDSCAADGYVNSIYTLAVGSADQAAKQAFYDENCTGKIAVTYSFNSKTFNNAFAYDQVSSTILDGGCTDSFTGTSASAPIMAGVAALVLQANPKLSWRDMQYLLAYTADYSKLKSSGDWTRNGGGLWVSLQYGFGAVDAEAMVTRARNWIPVPEQQSCVIYPDTSSGTATNSYPISLSFTVDSSSCSDVGFLEHVVVTTTLSLSTDGYTSYAEEDYYGDTSVLQQTGPRRGDISMKLVSPSGTTSLILPKRPGDYVNSEGYSQWPFMSLHHWGESPQGNWAITVAYDSNAGSVSLESFYVTLYGTASTPKAVKRIPSKCSSECVRGCAAKGSSYCDACKRLRIPSSLRCVATCPTGQCSVDGYCVHCSPFQLSTLTITGIASGALALLLVSGGLLFSIWYCKCRSSHPNYDTL